MNNLNQQILSAVNRNNELLGSIITQVKSLETEVKEIKTDVSEIRERHFSLNEVFARNEEKQKKIEEKLDRLEKDIEKKIDLIYSNYRMEDEQVKKSIQLKFALAVLSGIASIASAIIVVIITKRI